MVNFKYLGLPFLIGLIYCRKTIASCTFTYGDTLDEITVSADCDSSNNGYIYVKNGNGNEYRMIKYTYGGINGGKKDAPAGVYKINNEIYICNDSTTCIKQENNSFPFSDVGYHKYNDDKIYACGSKDDVGNVDDYCLEIQSIPNSCNSDTIGQYTSKGLCLAEYNDGENSSFPVLPFSDSDNDKYYFVKHVKSNGNDYRVFNFDVAMNYYIIKRTATSIALVRDNEEQKDQCASYETSEIIDRIKDFCGKGAGKYFNCEQGSGKCSSFVQSNSEVQETNGEKCAYSSASDNYKGYCIASTEEDKVYYLVDSGNNIIDSEFLNGNIIYLNSNYESNKASPLKGYYVNADVNTKEANPLIECNGKDGGCKFVRSNEILIGYYISSDEVSKAWAIKCISKTDCLNVLSEEFYDSCDINNSNSINIGKIKIVGTKTEICTSKGSIEFNTDNSEEYLLWGIKDNNFPGSTVGNYAVKMEIIEGETIGTISMIEKKTSCDSEDSENEIIKKDGKFYYCAGEIAIEMANNGVTFAISLNNSYKIIEITKNEKIIKNTEEYEGYYIDRSRYSNSLIYCSKASENNDGNVITCDSVNISNKDDYEVFINKEKKFPGNNGIELTANIIVCYDSLCEVPVLNNGKYVYNNYELSPDNFFINHQNDKSELIKCDTINGLCSPVETADGIYINGIKDMLLIKCTTEEDKYTCETKEAQKYSYYNSHANEKYISCNNEKCIEEAIDTESKWFLNGDESDLSNKIIKCIGDDIKKNVRKCEVISGNDYYIDSSNTDEMNLIKCDYDECTKVKGEDRGVYISDSGNYLIKCSITNTISNCQIIAGSIIDGNEINKYYINGDSSAENPIIKIIKNENSENTWGSSYKPSQHDIYVNGNHDPLYDAYGIIYCLSASSCSEVKTTNGEKYIDINNKKLIICNDNNECSDSNLNGSAYLVDKSNGKLVQTERSATGSLVVCENGNCQYIESGSNYYIDDGNTNTGNIIVNDGNGYTTYAASTMTPGYYINSSDSTVIFCNGTNCNYANENNYIVTECKDQNVGKLKKTNNGFLLCSEKSKEISKSNLYMINQPSNFPGFSGTNYVFINYEDSKITLVKSDIKSYYLINEKEQTLVTGTEAGKLYSCEEYVCDIVPEESETKYYPNSDSKTSKENQNIKCEMNEVTKKYECKLSSKSENEEYCLKNGSLSLCEKDCSESAKCSSIASNVGYYLSYEKNYLIECTSSTECREISKPNEGYYKSADGANPLIICDGSECKFVTSNEISTGYYISIPENSEAWAIKCDSKSNCSKVSEYYDSCDSNNIGKIKIDGTKTEICTSDGTKEFNTESSEEYILWDVKAGNFPGVIVDGNYVVKMENIEGKAIGTINMIEKKTSCDSEDSENEIIKKDGKFYYCAGEIAIEMANNGVTFAISLNNSYQIIEITKTERKIKNTEEYEGYYIDRSRKSNGLVYCSKDNNGNAITCNSVDIINKDDYEVFINKEKKFPGNNGIGLTANIIVCSGSSCEVPELNNGKYVYNNYELSPDNFFINHQNDRSELIKCDTINGLCSPVETADGIYINGIKDMLLIKCTTEKGKYACETKNAQKYSYYNSHVNEKYISCNNEKCIEEAIDTESKWFLNGDESDLSNKIIKCIGDDIKKNVRKCEVISGNDYYIDSSNTDEMNLIKCYNNECSKVKGDHREVYIADNGKYLIKCSIPNCKIIAGSIIDGKEKNKYYINGDSTAENPIIKIIKNENSENIWGSSDKPSQYDIYVNGNHDPLYDAYGIIYCLSASSCSEVKTTNGEKYIDINNKKLITCNDNNECSDSKLNGGAYLANKSNGKLVQTERSATSSLVICENEGNCQYQETGSNYYIDGGNAGNIIVNDGNGYTTYAASTMTPGYYINKSDSTIIFCDGKNCNDAIENNYIVTECNDQNIGKLKKTNNSYYLCNEESKEISKSDLYMINQPSNFPGFSGTNFAFINYEDSKITLVKSDIKSYYLINEKEQTLVTDTKAGILYTCEKYACVMVHEVITATEESETIYYPNSDSKTSEKKQNIKCDVIPNDTTETKYNYECTLSSKSANEEYCLKKDSLSLCKNNCSNSAKCSSMTSNVGYYLPYEKNYLIKCTSPTSCSRHSPKKGYYKSADNINPLIICKSSIGFIRCTYTTNIKNKNINDGYYIGAEQNVIIGCKNNKCNETTLSVSDSNDYYYINGENNKSLIKCKSAKCNELKPYLGWYKNGGKDVQLIQCIVNPKLFSLSCTEKDPTYDGSFIFAENSKKIINCTDGTCSNPVVGTDSYYINGENKKLIHCTSTKCEKTEINGWIKRSNTKLIYCDGDCVEKPAKNGYYINAVPENHKKILIKIDDGKINDVEVKDNGWYLNAGTTDISNRIIKCTSGVVSSCITKEAKTLKTTTSKTNGDFYEEGGEIKWYINNNIEYFTKDDNEKRNIFAENKTNSSIYVRYEIGKNSIIQKKADGYSYDEYNNLYWCNFYGDGYCTKIAEKDIIPGYYINHTPNEEQLIICNYDNEANKILCNNISIRNVGNCYKYNIANAGGKFKLCTSSSDVKYLLNFSVDTLYAIGKKNVAFPKPKDRPNTRYMLVDVNKYYIKYKEEIEEVKSCGDNTEESEGLVVCLNENNELIYEKTRLPVGKTMDEIIQINKNNVKENIQYDADTNDGYYEYTSDNEVNILKKVYIKKNDQGKDYKLVCDIDSTCLRQEMAAEPIEGFQFDHGVVKMKVRNTNSVNAVTTKIMPGSYIKYENGGTKSKKMIDCKDVNGEVECEENPITGFDYDPEKKEINVPSRNGNISSSKLFTKFILDLLDAISNKGKRDDNEVTILKELTPASYSQSSFNALTNVFLDSDNKRITNDIISSTDEKSIFGYMCKSDGTCSQIDNTGNEKYFLNSVQEGSVENAVAKCGYIKDSPRCQFIRAEEGLEFENYAATGTNDSIIRCYADGCKAESSSTTGQLPECQLNIINEIDKDDSTGSCIRADNQKPLLDGQHCINKGKIYKYNAENKSCTNDEMEKGIFLFDATYRMLKPNNVYENHYGAMLYRCPNKEYCYVTYGYIIKESVYTICTASGCMYNSNNSLLKSNCKEAGEGALIIGEDSTIKLCSSLGASSVSNINVDYAFQVSINSNDNFPETSFGDNILVGVKYDTDKTTIYYSLSINGFILTDNDNAIVSTDSESINSPTMYYCNSRQCNKVNNPEYGYYKSDIYSKYILVSKDNIMVLDGDKDINELFDLANDETLGNSYKEFGKDVFAGYPYSVIVETSKYKMVPFKADNYVLLNAEEKRLANENEINGLSDLYVCSASIGKCQKEDNIEDGWYVSGQTGYHAIQCENGSCSMKKTLNNECSGDGDFIYSEDKYQICIRKDENTIEKYKLVENIGKLSELIDSDNVFPNNKSYIIVQSNSVKGIGYRDVENNTTNNGIPVCESVDSKECVISDNEKLELNKYCTYENKIYSYVTEGEENVCKQQFTTGTSVKLFDGSSLVEASKEKETIYGTQLMYCKNGICTLTTGYKKLGETWYKCDYGTCTKWNESIDKETGNLINNSDGSTLYTTNCGNSNCERPIWTGTYYYYMSGSNVFPGITDTDSFIVEGNSEYIVPFIGEGYYLIDEVKGIMQVADPKESTYGTNKRENNHLYLCSKASKSCILKDGEAENKFYHNAGSSDSDKKALIGCYNGICTLAESNVIFDADYEKCTRVGNIVRKTNEADTEIKYNNYELCIAKGQNPVTTEVSNGKSKYYMLTLTKGDAFAGIKINDDVSRNIIVEVGDGYISQYEKVGYILFNESTNEIIDTEGNKGNLYYCSKTINYEGTTDKSYECKKEINLNNGWYFNDIYGDKRVIKCEEGVCSIAEIKETDKCVNNGSLIYNNGFKICQNSEKQIDIESIKNTDESFDSFDIIMNISLSSVFPGMTKNNKNILLSLRPFKIYQVKRKNNYVARDDNVVILSTGNLYECNDDGHCTININPRDNYYIKSDENGHDVELIKCENHKCHVINKDIENGFRVNGNIKLPIIQCVKPGANNDEGEFVETGIAECKEKEFKEGWFINSGDDSTEKPLIECTKESGCVKRNISREGWYLNAGANSEYEKIQGKYHPIIKCESNVCDYYKEEIKDKCSKGGEVISPSDNKYEVCKKEGKSVEFKYGNYDIIDNNGVSIVVKPSSRSILKYSGGYYINEGVMYECNNSCNIIDGKEKESMIVLENISNNLMTSTCNGDSCTWEYNTIEGNIFIDKNQKLLTNKESSVNKIYECLKNSNENVVCQSLLNNKVKGYFFNNDIIENGNNKSLLYKCENNKCTYIDDSKVRKCTELTYKSNYCYISYPNEENDKEYEGSEPVISAGEMCISDAGNYYFAIDEINTGIDKINCVQIPKDNSIKYYKVGNTLYAQNKFNTRVVSVNSVINGVNSNLLYKNNMNYELSGINGVFEINGYNFISCNNGKCDDVAKISTCTYNFQNGKCVVSSGRVSAGQICRSNEGRIYFALETLTSDGGKCVNHSTGWRYSTGSSSVEPDYSDEKYTSIERYESIYYLVNNKLYRIDKNNEITIMKEGVYLIDNGNKKVNIANNSDVDISENSLFKLYICNSDGCKIKNTCNANTNYEYIFDSQNEKYKVIRCDPATNSIRYEKSNGYFVNTPWEDLIQCINGKCIEIDKTKGMEGYYIDAGNDGKVIKCVRNGIDIFKCISENAITCNYDGNSCSSEVDLLRNSYCLYTNTNKDKSGKIIRNPMMLYVSDYIRANDKGKCIANEGTDEYYYHYRKSKFLGYNEREEIIKFSKGVITSIFEMEMGYYIISTENRMGITENMKFNKSRLYECTSEGCKEQHNPVNDRIYINKASNEKMVRYNNGYWEIMERHCKINKNNLNQCEFPTNNIKAGDVLYIYEEGYTEPIFKTSLYTLDTESTHIKKNNEEISTDKYQYFPSDKKMYLLSKNKQYFDVVNEPGYYMFKKRNDLPKDVKTYYNNLEPYRSTINTTDATLINLYELSSNWNVNDEFSLSTFTDGYYLNKADIEKEGVVIQVMDVPLKKEIAEVTAEEKPVNKYKSIINKCLSNIKNNCVTAQEGKKISAGDVCVVFDGEYPGLYLAINDITNNSSGTNCIRSSNGNGYHYTEATIEFAAEPHEKIIFEVTENSIKPFNKVSNIGYYVIDNAEKKLLTSTDPVKATGYKCGLDKNHYVCNSEGKSNKYYRTENNNNVFSKSANEWYIESKRGYYFFNEDNVAATTDVVYKFGNIVNPGTYLNSAITDNNVHVIIVKDSNTEKIKTENKLCNINVDGSCTSSDKLSNGEVCYENNLLYLVEVIGDKKYMCYTGSEKVKYRLVNDMLYKLDGLSVQEVSKGYYILNENWEEYSSDYPEIPNAVIYCDAKCEKLTGKIEINSDVIYNSAATGNNKILRYYSSSGKFVNVKKSGYYMVNSHSEVTNEFGIYDYIYYLNEDGTLSDLTDLTDFGINNIYINYAKEGSLTRNKSQYKDGKYITYNKKTDRIEYDGMSVENNNDIIIRIIDTYWYRQLPKSFEEIPTGLYAIKDNAPFTDNKFTSLDTGIEICYYIGDGKCDSEKLNELKKQKYIINNATLKPTILEYSSEDKWRMVDEDGVYFFFEDGYSITSTDRRISKVYEVIEGQTIDITNDENRLGFYKFNDMMIESNEKDGWIDGFKLVGTVEVNKRICNSYEINEIINSEKFCYNKELGLVCLPKKDISNSNNESNCIFNSGSGLHYFLNGDKLQSISGQALKNIKKPGLYIVNGEKKIYEDVFENKAFAYKCDNEGCKIEEELQTGYYLNMANGRIDKPIILYYNDSNKTWRKATVDGYYLFNENGYALDDGEKVAYAFKIEKEGNSIKDTMDEISKGIYINQSSSEKNIVVEYNNKWETAKGVPECKIDSNGIVKSNESMKVGDICLDQKKLVFVISSNDSEKEIRGEEYSYEGISADNGKIKYGFNSSNSSIVKLNEGTLLNMEISGYVIIDKNTSLPIESESDVEALIYKCDIGNCEAYNMTEVNIGTRFINAISDDTPLIKYKGENKWNIESEEGYYFFGNDDKPVGVDGIVNYAVEVRVDNNNKVLQRDITELKNLGFYFNKANENKVLLSNDELLWSKGSSLHKCNISEIETGYNCRTLKNTLDAGDYCYDGNKIFLLLKDINEISEEVNCVSGSNSDPLYLESSNVGILNGVSNNKLIKLTDDSIKLVEQGYYILNNNGTLIDNNGEGEIEMKIYRCEEMECIKEEMENNIKFLSESDIVYEINENGKLIKVVNEGIYFFTEGGKACIEESDVVDVIIKITKNEESVNIERVNLKDMEIGVYINNANDKSLGIYDGKKWNIEEKTCVYGKETSSCSSELNLEVGSYCIVEGSLYVVTEINEDDDIKRCTPGSNESPIFMMRDESSLLMIKKSSIKMINNNGYYAINSKTNEGFSSETSEKIKFIKCEYDGACMATNPIKNSSYLNRAVINGNIVKFNITSSDIEAVSSELHCNINGSSCTIDNNEINTGDICIAENSLYLIMNEEQCIKAEKFIERLKFVNNKIYKLSNDIVTQMFDGYYFMNGDGRTISNVMDYSNVDTIAYMCSIYGECYEIEPNEVRYFKDYATEVDGKFKVVVFDPEKKSRRREIGSSGYEIITEEGIYRLDDGSYVNCEIGSNDYVICSDIKEKGTKVTIDGEYILCSKNDDRKIQCHQATEGGYYFIEDKLMECEANEERDKLDCKEVKKEGYFLSDGKNKILYECESEKVDISRVINELNADFEDIYETDHISEEIVEDIIEINKREEIDENEKEGNREKEEEIIEKGEETGEKEKETEVKEEESIEIDNPNMEKEPVDVVCVPLVCTEGRVINSGGENSVDLYICTKNEDKKPNESEEKDSNIEAIEDDDEENLQWIAKNCDSGNFLMENDNFYTCESQKENIDEEYIKKPNSEHTSTENTSKTKTASTTEEESVTSTKSNSSNIPDSKTTDMPSISTTASKTTTTTTKSTTSSTSTTEGSGASTRYIYSISLYLILFIFSIVLHF